MSKEAEVFRDRLRMLREERGMTQQELATVLDITRTSVSGYERGDRKPEFDMIIKIANTFNKPVDYLLGRTEIDSGVDNNLVAFLSNLKSGNIEHLMQRWYNNNNHESYIFNEDDTQLDEMLRNFVRMLYSLIQIDEYENDNINDNVKLLLSSISMRKNANFKSEDYKILLNLIHTYYDDYSVSKFANLKVTERSSALALGKDIAKLPAELQSTLQVLVTCVVKTVSTKPMMENELCNAYSMIGGIESKENIKRQLDQLEGILEIYNNNFNITMKVVKAFYEQHINYLEGDNP